MITHPIEEDLQKVLLQLIDDIRSSQTQYMVAANYYEHQLLGRQGERWYIAMIWLSADTADNVRLSDQGLLCDVRLNRHDLDQVSRILMPYSQIWQVQRLGNEDHFTEEDIIYYQSHELNLTSSTDD